MNWAELLLKNWFVVVIIFIIVNRLFKWFKKPVNSSAPPVRPTAHNGTGMPPFGGGGGWSSIPGMSKGATSTPKTEPPTGKSPIREADNSTSAVVSDFWNDTSIADEMPENSKPHTGLLEPSNNDRSGAASNKLIQGVIWAEILGPPRSKKPFRN